MDYLLRVTSDEQAYCSNRFVRFGKPPPKKPVEFKKKFLWFGSIGPKPSLESSQHYKTVAYLDPIRGWGGGGW